MAWHRELPCKWLCGRGEGNTIPIHRHRDNMYNIDIYLLDTQQLPKNPNVKLKTESERRGVWFVQESGGRERSIIFVLVVWLSVQSVMYWVGGESNQCDKSVVHGYGFERCCHRWWGDGCVCISTVPHSSTSRSPLTERGKLFLHY